MKWGDFIFFRLQGDSGEHAPSPGDLQGEAEVGGAAAAAATTTATLLLQAAAGGRGDRGHHRRVLFCREKNMPLYTAKPRKVFQC